MTLDELKLSRDNTEQEFNNLTNHEWLVNYLKTLKARFDLYNELINKMESETTDAATPAD